MELTGEYFLQGVREMASGFLLKEDNTFQFFFSYGALDRHGSGRWEAKNDVLFFNSSSSSKILSDSGGSNLYSTLCSP